MGMLSSIVDMMTDRPSGPTYTLGDLRFHTDEYVRHVEDAHGILFRTLSDKRWTMLLYGDIDGKAPSDILSDIKWVYLNNVRSWMYDEFIQKIGRFSPGGSAASSPGAYRRPVCACHVDEVYTARSHLRACREHSSEVVDALHFFLCDGRTPFKIGKSLDDGMCSSIEVARWYTNGKRIVESNMTRINDWLCKFIDRL